ncbi:class I SAM-dependent methyltransferase [uncultured Aureimonas sp.]|uniref:class I SAM-dependent methyltransferase n=1 Tax=uncultured Aureimonas sp. TaxID=1604662 RepID=UPI0025E6EF1B|nr:class I SAM-dependent methyltransferase [uncultured Aureimonas sp.]
MTWSQGYVTDVDYTFGYYPELNPAMLDLACLCHGVAPPLGDKPRYLELGFGQGVSINLHAAGSDGSYWGTDFNSAHVAGARTLARVSGADIRLLEDSFEEFATRTDLPDFDAIVLHGVWSWITDAGRASVKDIVRQRLRPGGIVYVSYNCLPGWAPIAPIREMMAICRDRSRSGANGTILEARALLNELVRAGADCFRDNPLALHHLETLRRQDPAYLAHEYLNADWRLENVSALVRDLRDAKLTFLGPARLLDAVDAIQLGVDGRKLIARFDDAVMRETLRDHLVNRRFRADIFAKGPRRLTGPELREAWHELAFVLMVPAIDVPKRIPCARGEAELDAQRYDPLIEALAGGGYRAKTIDELLATPGLSDRRSEDVAEALTILAGAGLVSPARPLSVEKEARCSALNAYILGRARVSMDLQHLASPATGGGVRATHVGQLFALAHGEGEDRAEALAQYVWRFLESVGERLTKDGNRLEAKDDNLRALMPSAERFLKFDQPHLRGLRVI